MFKPYKVGTTITDQFMENKLGCFDANILTKNIVDVPSLSKNSNHPTEKPVELLEWLINTYTNENDTVLDNCMGSGTTGVACKNLNRNFIGIELLPNYFKIAEKRINENL
jgi:site-specific DNA-methyltransferase (adenine-specific)